VDLRPLLLHEDQTAALAQALEDAMGCRTAVAGMLLLPLPPEVVDELAACDQDLSRLIVVTLRRLGLATSLN
jgi:hypothetical protein